MHEKMRLTHTDLKPENILLKMDTKKQVKEQNDWPIQVKNKKIIYAGMPIAEESEAENDEEQFQFDNQPNSDHD